MARQIRMLGVIEEWGIYCADLPRLMVTALTPQCSRTRFGFEPP